MAAAAFAAFVLPATASAINDPTLTEGGTDVAVGSEFVGTASSTEFTTTASAPLFTCSTAKLTGKVTKNSGSSVEAEVPKGSAIFSGTGAVHVHNNVPECTGSFGNVYTTLTTAFCFRSDSAMATDEFQVTGCAGKVKFMISSTTAGACEYESTGAVLGSYTTGGAEAKLTVRNTSAGSGFTKISGGFLCPSSGALKWTFALEPKNGAALTIS
jgi:hypothetical protein